MRLMELVEVVMRYVGLNKGGAKVITELREDPDQADPGCTRSTKE